MLMVQWKVVGANSRVHRKLFLVEIFFLNCHKNKLQVNCLIKPCFF